MLIIVFVLALLLWLTSIPLVFRFEIDTDEAQQGRVIFSWLYGLVVVRKKMAPPAAKSGTHREARPQQRIEQQPRGRSGKFLLAFLGSEGVVPGVIRWVLDNIRAADVRVPRLYCRFGLDDPADTGRCFGMLSPLIIFLRQQVFSAARIEPDFHGAAFELKACMRVRIIPLRHLWLLLRFIFSAVMWRGLWAGVVAHRA